MTYNEDIPDNGPPSWMSKTFELWFQNPLEILESQIGNPDFDGEIDYSPKQVLGKNGKRQFTDLQWVIGLGNKQYVHTIYFFNG